MCGIAGVFGFASEAEVSAETLRAMVCRLRHRGPDDEGVFLDGPAGLAHTRLAIIDLSPLGHQPFSDEASGATIVYNGEIYNYKELRAVLEQRGHRFRSRTDTEVVLRSYLEFGAACVERLTGMFAFAIWDARHRRLFLARDRVGEKPLVYAEHDGRFTFASEIGALLADAAVPRTLDATALGMFLATTKFIPYPRTAFEHVKKLPPGHTLTVDRSGLVLRRYWAPDFSHKAGGGLDDAVERLDEVLGRTVTSMMMSDVPIGLLLSGGVDSSSIACAMRPQAADMRTFACGDSAHDEEFLRARTVAKRLATRHAEHIFTLEPGALLRLTELFGEPMFEGSVIYRLQMCEFIRRQGVTVLLSGDGADEVFGGYESYSWLRRYPALKRVLARILAAASPETTAAGDDSLRARVERYASPVGPAVAAGLARAWRGHLARVGCRAPAAEAGVDEMRATVAAWLEAARVVNVVDGALFADLMVALHYNHVMIPDAVGMAHSLELRSPFMDQRLVEFAASLPVRFKVDRRPSLNKKVLKRWLAHRLPAEHVYAAKIGYGGNIQYLLRHQAFWGELYRRTLRSGHVRDLGLIDPSAPAMAAPWESRFDRFQMAWRVALVVLELWLDRTFGSGRFAGTVEDEFASAAARNP